MKKNQTIKVGDKIKHTTFSGKMFEGVITSIEKCNTGEKYGTPVESAIVGDDRYTMCLDNGKWCYGSQILN